jgi:formamidopyrimidine-DNA glycosylase
MPELPEVETIRLGLAELLPGKLIIDVKYDWPKSFLVEADQLDKKIINSTVTGISRRTKVLMINLSSGYSLVIHLKMTGQLVYRSKGFRFGAGHPNDSLVGNLPDKSTRVEISFSDKSKLFFNDQRKFGWMKLVSTPSLTNEDFFKHIGPEPLDDSFSPKILKLRLMRFKNRNIKAALLDQTVIAGLGNIYADESLWEAKIHPLTLVSNISDEQFDLLHQGIIKVLKLSIKKGGSTNRNYVNAEGKKGSYIEFANVYKREGQDCGRCGNTIIKIRVAGRGTHICPHCQKLLVK